MVRPRQMQQPGELFVGLWNQLPRQLPQQSVLNADGLREGALNIDEQTLDWEVGMYLYQFVAQQMNSGQFAQTEAILQKLEEWGEMDFRVATDTTTDAHIHRVVKAFARVAGMLLRDPAPVSIPAASDRSLSTDAAAPSAAAALLEADLKVPSLAGTSAGRMLGGSVSIPSTDDFKGVTDDQARVLHALGKARFWRNAFDPGTPPDLLKRQADAFFKSVFEAWSPQPSEAERTGFLRAFSQLLDSDPPQLQFWQMDKTSDEPYRATSLAMLKAMTTSAKDQLRAANESRSLKQAASESGAEATAAVKTETDRTLREALPQ